MIQMGDTYQIFNALPPECHSTLGRKVPEEEADKMIELYCEECERRHEFVPSDD